MPGGELPSSPGAITLPQTSQRLRRWGLALFDPRSQFVAHGRICRLHGAQPGVDLGGYDEAGKLSGESVERDEGHRDQQHGGDYADEDVSHDEPIAQAPQKFSL